MSRFTLSLSQQKLAQQSLVLTALGMAVGGIATLLSLGRSLLGLRGVWSLYLLSLLMVLACITLGWTATAFARKRGLETEDFVSLFVVAVLASLTAAVLQDLFWRTGLNFGFWVLETLRSLIPLKPAVLSVWPVFLALVLGQALDFRVFKLWQAGIGGLILAVLPCLSAFGLNWW